MLEMLALLYLSDEIVEIMPRFEQFLKDEGAYEAFIANIKLSIDLEERWRFFGKKSSELVHLITWNRTEEKSDYWCAISLKWEDVCRTLKN